MGGARCAVREPRGGSFGWPRKGSIVRSLELRREGLLTALEEELVSTRLMVLKAPRGFGKSTLLRQFRASRDPSEVSFVNPSWWGGLQGRSFWENLLDDVAGPPLVSSGEGPDSAFTAFVTWARSLERPVTILVDNYEQLTSHDLDGQLVEALRQAPDLQFVVAGRRFVRLAGPLMGALVRTRILTKEDLRFPDSEVEQAWSRAMPAEPLPRDALRAIDGWPLALAFIREEKLGSLRVEGVDLLAAEALALVARSPKEQRVASIVGLFPGVSGEAIALALEESEKEIFAVLYALADVGLVEVRGSEGSAEYHPVPSMKDFLAQQSLRWLSEPVLRKLRLFSAPDIEAEKSGKTLQYLLSQGRFASAEEFLVSRFVDTDATFDELLTTLRRLDSDTRTQYPVLVGLRLALEMTAGDRLEGELRRLGAELREACYARLGHRNPALPPITRALLTLVETRLGNWEEAITYLNDLAPRLQAQSQGEGADEESVAAMVVAGQSALRAGEIELARELFLEVSNTGKLRPGGFLEALTLSGQALAAATQGDIAASAEFLKALEEANLSREESGPSPSVTRSNAEAALLMRRHYAPPAPGSRSASQASVKTRKDHWPYFAFLEADLVRKEEGPYLALVSLLASATNLGSTAPIAPRMFVRLWVAVAEFAMYCGQLNLAAQILGELDGESRRVAVAIARLHLFSGRPDLALEELNAHDDGRHVETELDALLLEAIVLFDLGHEDIAVQALERYASAAGTERRFSALDKVPYELLEGLAEASARFGEADLSELTAAVPPRMRVRLRPKLTPIQKEVLHLLTEGLSNLDIGRQLGRTEDSVKSHLQVVFRELGVDTRWQATLQTLRFGWSQSDIEDPDVLDVIRASLSGREVWGGEREPVSGVSLG